MKYVKVKNRNNGYTGYTIPDRNIVRNFAPSEVKTVEEDELKQLSFLPGGDYLLRNYLIIEDDSVLDTLNMTVEPEYFYTEDEVKILLSEDGNLGQLEDALNFSPQGVIELIKQQAVEMEIPDLRKRRLITEKTGFNIDNAINLKYTLNEEDDASDEPTPTRKAEPLKVKKEAPKYKSLDE